MENSQILQIGIGAVIVLIVLILLVENIADPRKLAKAKANTDDASGSESTHSRR